MLGHGGMPLTPGLAHNMLPVLEIIDMPHQNVFIADSLENSTPVSDLKKYVTVRFLTKNGI